MWCHTWRTLCVGKHFCSLSLGKPTDSTFSKSCRVTCFWKALYWLSRVVVEFWMNKYWLKVEAALMLSWLSVSSRDHVFAINLASSAEQIIPQQVGDCSLSWHQVSLELFINKNTHYNNNNICDNICDHMSTWLSEDYGLVEMKALPVCSPPALLKTSDFIVTVKWHLSPKKQMTFYLPAFITHPVLFIGRVEHVEFLFLIWNQHQ